MINPTPMQKTAIESDGCILVSAAAGSGKTAVLTERVIRKLTDPQNPIDADRLLIVTFTNAAAAEMRSRIENRLFELIRTDPDNMLLLKQQRLLAAADICTIDSFCIRLVRENFELCGVGPDFTVNDGSALSAVRSDVMSRVLEPYIGSENADFSFLLELTGCEYDERNLIDTIEKIYLYSQQQPFPKVYLQSLTQPYKTEFSVGNVWYDKIFEITDKKLTSAQNDLAAMAEAAVYIEKSEKCTAYVQALSMLLENLLKTSSLRDYALFSSAVHSAGLGRIPSMPSDDPNAALFKAKKQQIADKIKYISELFMFTKEEISEQSRGVLPAIELLVKLINDYSEKLLQAFIEENILTFYNTEQLARELLCDYSDTQIVIKPAARALSDKYDEVMVDEFQDVNDLQNMLFYALSDRGKKLFTVGDVKQSIYGFRGSNPRNFLSQKQAYVPVAEAADDDPKKIILSNNFRSRSGVCKIINYFFGHLLSGAFGEIVYDEEERLNPAAKFPKTDAPEAELLFIDKTDAEDDDPLIESEGAAIADYIKRVMSEGPVIRKSDTELRNARYSDFVILMSTVQDKAAVVSQALTSAGIPVSYNSQTFLETTEISRVISLLKVIDNPGSDVELLCVMMSPPFSFSADEVALMRADHHEGDLYSCVINAAKNGNIKAQKFIESLAEMRLLAAAQPVCELIPSLLDSTDMINRVCAMPGGSERRANLFTLMRIAQGYCEGGRGSIYGFLKYISSLPQSAFKSGASSQNDCVRIMSMHSSKGLQFPICIIADLSSRINTEDSISRVLYSSEYGIGFKYYDESAGADVELPGHRINAIKARESTIEERLRLLYVAMTRAEDRLCLVCSVKNAQKRLSGISEHLLLKEPFIDGEWLAQTTSMCDWLLACAMLHPDAAPLMQTADIHAPCAQSESGLKITVINGASSRKAKVSEPNVNLLSETPDAVLSKAISDNFKYKYPYENLVGIQAKVSVSEAANGEEAESFAFTSKPAFMLSDGLTAAGKGTAMHHIMQFISFDGIPDVDSEIERLADMRFITASEAHCADTAALKRFFNSELYKRICRSCDVRREMRFLTEVPAGRIYPEITGGGDAQIIVQGAVDLCFEEDGGFTVVDFKTDRVDDISILANRYRNQIEIYSSACEKITGKPVKEKIIYSFELSDYVII